MIDHRPFGIDDPYKRQPTERYPRDPVAGDAPQIGFRVDDSATKAWTVVTGPGRSELCRAQHLGDGLWTSQLPPLEAGSYSYTIHACLEPHGPDSEKAEDAEARSREISSESFDLPVGKWLRVDAVADVAILTRSVRLLLQTEAGARAHLDLSVPIPGVCRTIFRPLAGGGQLSSAPGSEHRDDLPLQAERAADTLTVSAEGIELRVDLKELRYEAFRPGEREPVTVGCLEFEWLELPDASASRFRTGFDLAADEELYGLGERFEGPGLRGAEWDVRVYEEYKEQGKRTYVPVPFCVSSRAWGVWIDSDAPSYLDASGERAAFTVDSAPGIPGEAELEQYLIVAGAPYEVTAAFTRLTGEIALPPEWAFGPWMSANTWNSQAKVEEAVRRTIEEDVPATVVVIEAWSDESTFYIFNDAEYQPVAGSERFALKDFRFGGRWPDPKGMIDEFHENGMRLLLWQIPVQKRLDEPHAQHDADEAHMLEQGYAIAKEDGTPYRNAGWWFTDALVLDVTNSEACEWWFDKRRYLFEDLGIDGMKTDGGEHLWGRGLRAANGQRGSELVNRFAQAYVDAYHDFVRRMTSGDGLTFSRAGYTGAQRSPAHWAGDENSTWNAFRASIQAGLTAGLSGISIWGWDIGGFSGEVPAPELYIRSTQMAAFCPVMQYHSELHGSAENRDRTPWNVAERHGDRRALTIYGAYAKLRMALLDYISGEAQALAAQGQPLMRYPGLIWPQARERLMNDSDTYLFGRDLLVAPVLEKGAQTREVELPPGDWVDFWSGAMFEGDRSVVVPAPLERLPVFVQARSPRLSQLREAADLFEEFLTHKVSTGG